MMLGFSNTLVSANTPSFDFLVPSSDCDHLKFSRTSTILVQISNPCDIIPKSQIATRNRISSRTVVEKSTFPCLRVPSRKPLEKEAFNPPPLQIPSRRIAEKCEKNQKWLSYGGILPTILQSLDTIEDIDEALKSWEESLNNKEQTIILKSQTNWRRAIDIFEWFKQKQCYEINIIHYNIILRILGKAHQWERLENLWFEMQQIKDVNPTNSTYATLIDVFSKGGLHKQALVWLGDMLKQGLEPDEVTVSVIIQTYKTSGEFKSAAKFFQRWSSCMGATSCNTYTYNTLIDTYGKAGCLKEASETFANMLSRGIVPNIVTFNTMIHICGNNDRLEEVSELMLKMEELRCLPNIRTYNILISVFVKGGDIEKASGYFAEMKNCHLVPDTVSYRTLLYAYSIRQMVCEAELLISEMEALGIEVDEFTQSALMRMYINHGNIERSCDWFAKFQDTMSSECYAANIDALGMHGLLEQAEQAYWMCKKNLKLSVVVFNVMIKIYGLAHEYNRACQVFDSMEGFGILPDKCTFNSIVQILAISGLPERARFYLHKMQKAGLVEECIPYSAVISSYVKIKDLKTAEALFSEMIETGVNPDIFIFGVLINAFVESGSVGNAKKYVKLLEEAGLKANSIICNSLIKLYTKARLLEESESTYKLFQSLTNDVDNDTTFDIYSSNCMMELYCEKNMVSSAEEIFKHLKHSRQANEFSYSMMVCLYKKTGLITQALSVAQEMCDTCVLTDALSYSTLIELFALNGRFRDAARTFKQMVNFGVEPNEATFRSLGVSLVNRGVPKEAVQQLELARRKNSECGIQAWVKSVQTMLGFDDDFGLSVCAQDEKIVKLVC